MIKPPKADLDALIREAKASEHRESYRTIERGASYLLRVGVRAGTAESCFLEIAVRLGEDGPKVDLPSLEEALNVLKALDSSGYSLSWQEGTVTCEKEVLPSIAAAEILRARGILASRR